MGFIKLLWTSNDLYIDFEEIITHILVLTFIVANN